MRVGLGLVLAVAILALGTAVASAAPIPPGNYTAEVTGGEINLAGVSATIPAGGSTTLTIGTDPVEWPLGSISLPPLTDVPFSGGGAAGEIDGSVTIGNAPIVSIDPTTGIASATITGHATMVLTITAPAATTSTCAFGTPASPITVNPTSAPGFGSPWDPATGAMTLRDINFVAPVDCDGVLGGVIEAAIPANTAGSNELRLDTTLIRAPDPPLDATNPGPTNTGTPVGTVGDPATGDQGTDPPSRCKVPKLTGLTLKKAKRKITKAGCKVGKIKRRASRKKPGTVLGQGPAAGKLVKTGTTVNLTVAKRTKR